MAINLSNFLISKKDRSKMADFQDLDHLDGLSISVTSANLYNNNRDDLVFFILEMEQSMHLFIQNQK